MPTFDQDEIVKTVKDTLYAVVGAGVLTAEHLDKLRVELAERLSVQLEAGKGHVDQLAATFDRQVRSADARVQVVVEQIDGVLEGAQDRLPEQAGEVLAAARRAGAAARQQVRGLVLRDAA